MSAELEKIAGQLDRIVEILELLHKIKEREREKFPKTKERIFGNKHGSIIYLGAS